MARPLRLEPDRYFDSDPVVRRAARELYEETRTLPLVCPHGHVEASVLADDEAFAEPTALIVTPDHYILRLLYSQGVAPASLGVRTRDGAPFEQDARKAWRIFAGYYYLFRATPTGAWLDHELAQVFGVDVALDADTADHVYDHIAERLVSPEYRPRALYDRFNIEILATTDAATDTLDNHRRIRESGWPARIIPTFRPDSLLAIADGGWLREIESLAATHGSRIIDFRTFLDALRARRAFFAALGATATDHGVVSPWTYRLSDEEAEQIFEAALAETVTAEQQRRFHAHMLMEMAAMSVEDGMVMQLHAGALRNHNGALFDRYGANMGGDIPVRTEFTRNLQPLLEAYGNDARLMLIVFTLDESTYARELAPLAGHYPALRLGPPWWFHDSIEGMLRFRQQTTETAGIYNTAGFNDDTRAFCSLPARHDLARRVDANFLAGLVARHVLDLADARVMARLLAGDLARAAYRLGNAA